MDNQPLPPPKYGIVDRCVCMQVSFAQWLAHKRDNNLTMEQIAEQTGCGCGCGSCAPYLGVVDATGRTELEPMSYDEMLHISRGAE